MGWYYLNTAVPAFQTKNVHALILYHFASRSFGEAEHTSADIKQLIDQHLASKEEMEALLPQHIVIGPFYLNTESIRTAVAKKHRDVSRALLDFLARKLRRDADLVCGCGILIHVHCIYIL